MLHVLHHSAEKSHTTLPLSHAHNHHLLRSPLTVHALRGYLSLELDALHSHLPSAFKDLATLARSADITVRREVQALMQSRISPMVAAIADAGRWL